MSRLRCPPSTPSRGTQRPRIHEWCFKDPDENAKGYGQKTDDNFRSRFNKTERGRWLAAVGRGGAETTHDRRNSGTSQFSDPENHTLDRKSLAAVERTSVSIAQARSHPRENGWPGFTNQTQATEVGRSFPDGGIFPMIRLRRTDNRLSRRDRPHDNARGETRILTCQRDPDGPG